MKKLPFDLDLGGKVVVVTGAGGVLCSGFAKTAAQCNAKVAVLDLNLEAAQAVERGVVDIETINKVNQNLIDSISGSYEIAQKAITERAEGAKQLQNNEAELKKAIVKYTKLN